MENSNSGKVKSLTFYATERHQAPDWILKKIADLVGKAKRLTDSSSVLYACLEARNLLEMLSISKLHCSVSAVDRDAITIEVKPLNGIKGVNKRLKALGLKTQEFMSAVCEQNNQPFPIFDFTECDNIQHKLSQYIHTYTVVEADMDFGSSYINDGFAAIDEAIAFAKYNLFYSADRNTYNIINADMTNLPEWAKALLNDWKSGKIKEKSVLDIAIAEESQKYIDNLSSGNSSQSA